MNNFVEPIKLTEPVKPVQSSSGQRNSQQQEHQAQGKDDFQRMLDQQVESRRQQEKQQAKKSENQSKPAQNQQTQAKKADSAEQPKGKVVRPEDNVRAENPAIKPEDQAIVKDTSAKPAKTQPTVVDKTKVATSEKSDKPIVDIEKETLADEKPAQPKVDLSNSGKTNKPNVITKSHKGPKDKSKVQDTELSKTESKEVAELDAKNSKPHKVQRAAQQQTEAQPEAVSHQDEHQKLANVHVKADETVKTVDKKITPKSGTDINQSASKQIAQNLAQQTNQAPQAVPVQQKNAAEEVTTAADLIDPEEALAELDARTAPKHSVIAELQKAALEKREFVKLLQKDLSVNAEKSALSEAALEAGDELTADMMTGNRTADFIQTMNQQANAVKQAIHRPVTNDFAKTEAVKESATKPVENPAALANTAATPSAQATAMSPSAVMNSAPLGSSNQIYAYPGKNGWNQAISQKVVYMVGAGDQSARLNLNPPELGPLQVVIQVNNEKADATFISDNAEVRQALEDGMEYLKEKMDEAGVALGQANVNDGQQFSQQEQQTAFQSFANNNSNGNTMTQGKEEAATSSQKVQTNNNGLVDTFA